MIAIFLILLAWLLVGLAFAAKGYERRRLRRMAQRLETAVRAPVETSEALLRQKETAQPGGLEGLLAGLPVGRWMAANLRQAGSESKPSQLFGSMLMFAAVGSVAGVLLPVGGPPLARGGATALAGGWLPLMLLRRKRSKRLSRMEEQLPDALDFLARSMRAGHAFTISLEMLGEEIPPPLGQEIRTVFNEHNLGAPLELALRNLCERVPLLDVRFFTSAVAMQRQTGGNLSEILGRLAYVIRERFRLKGQVRSASAHGRMTASILTLLPVVTMLALLLVAPGYIQSMFRDPDGQKIVAGAVVAQLLGNLVMRKIVKIKV